jgi:hypothetical protein
MHATRVEGRTEDDAVVGRDIGDLGSRRELHPKPSLTECQSDRLRNFSGRPMPTGKRHEY